MGAFGYLVVTLFYLIVAGIGILLSYPLTIVLIAYDQALANKEKIRKHLDPESTNT